MVLNLLVIAPTNLFKETGGLPIENVRDTWIVVTRRSPMNKTTTQTKSSKNNKNKGISYPIEEIGHVNTYNHTFISINVTGVYFFLNQYDIVHYLYFSHEPPLIFKDDFRKDLLEPIFYDLGHNFVICITQRDGPKLGKEQ
jgi:hypothetical protein